MSAKASLRLGDRLVDGLAALWYRLDRRHREITRRSLAFAYGPELGRTHPAGAQNPEWGVRLRVWSTGMALLGEERGGRGRGGSGRSDRQESASAIANSPWPDVSQAESIARVYGLARRLAG